MDRLDLDFFINISNRMLSPVKNCILKKEGKKSFIKRKEREIYRKRQVNRKGVAKRKMD